MKPTIKMLGIAAREEGGIAFGHHDQDPVTLDRNGVFGDRRALPFVQDQHVVQTLGAESPDDPLRDRVGPWRPEGRQQGVDPERLTRIA